MEEPSELVVPPTEGALRLHNQVLSRKGSEPSFVESQLPIRPPPPPPHAGKRPRPIIWARWYTAGLQRYRLPVLSAWSVVVLAFAPIAPFFVLATSAHFAPPAGSPSAAAAAFLALVDPEAAAAARRQSFGVLFWTTSETQPPLPLFDPAEGDGSHFAAMSFSLERQVLQLAPVRGLRLEFK